MTRLWLWALAAMASACTGEFASGLETMPPKAKPVDPPKARVSAARDFFEREVQPTLVAQCGSCHVGQDGARGPNFLGTRADQAYAQLVTRPDLAGSPAQSRLLQKGVHEGPAPTAELAQKVMAWLGMEGAQSPATAMTASAAIALFGRCMTQADFDASKLLSVAKQPTTAGPCYSCHDSGMGGASLSRRGPEMLRETRQAPYIFKLATTSVKADGSFKEMVLATRFRDKGIEGDGQHPQYVLTDERQQAVQAFFDLTLAHFQSGDCP
jgi:cytochrome c553